MSANFKRVWYTSCVKCGKKGPLVDGDERMKEVQVLLGIYGWTFLGGKPLCKKHSPKPPAHPPGEDA